MRRELCEHLPGPDTSLLLGDAFMNILEVSKGLMAWPVAPQSYLPSGREGRDPDTFPLPTTQPEKALEAYDEAYKKNPHDASLVSRIGRAYVKAHEYTKVRLGWAGRGGEGQPSREEGGGCLGGRGGQDGRGVAEFPPSTLRNGVPRGELGHPPPLPTPAQVEA